MAEDEDPFASNRKTVIRPNVGSLNAQKPQQSVASDNPFEKNNQKTRIGGLSPGGRIAPGTEAQQNALGQGNSNEDNAAWMVGGAKEAFFPDKQAIPEQQPINKIPLEVALKVNNGYMVPASNALTNAAAPLLMLLGRLRMNVIDMQAVPLMEYVKEEIENFERKLQETDIEAHDVQVAKYALCGTADDIVQNLPGSDRGVWLQYSMLAQFFNVRTSGVGFFDELNKVLANPLTRVDLLELMHACLCLGFEGQYRTAQGGEVTLQRVRRDVYQTLRQIRPRSDDDISVRWQGMIITLRNRSRNIPSWIVASFAALILVGAFILFRLLLTGQGEALADQMNALHPKHELRLARIVPVVDVKPIEIKTSQLDRIKAGLVSEIDNGDLNVEASGEFIILEINNLILFASGSADVKPEFSNLAIKIASTLTSERGDIYVVGHTDSIKPRTTSRFKSNYDLSVERAKSVEAALASGLEDPQRIQVSGKGADVPKAPNDTKEGRAQNRRVEISIPREETLQ